MTRNSVAASIRKQKELHPERYCAHRNCLYRTGGGYCKKHAPDGQNLACIDSAKEARWITDRQRKAEQEC